MDADKISIVLGALLALSEILGSFSFFQHNSIFQLIVGVIKKLTGK